MKNLVCFSSGGPNNFATVVDFCDAYPRDARVVALVSDRDAIPSIELAHARGIEHRCFCFDPLLTEARACPRRHATCDAILAYMDELEMRHGPLGTLVLAFRRVLAGRLVERFAGRMINVHPADLSVIDLSTHLPRYVGIGGLHRSLTDGNAESRTSVHLVDDGVDTGRLLCLGPALRFEGCADSDEQVTEHQRRQKSVSDRPALWRALEIVVHSRTPVPVVL